MATLTIKNIPDAVYRRIKRQAAQRRRSLTRKLLPAWNSTLGALQLTPRHFLRRFAPCG